MFLQMYLERDFFWKMIDSMNDFDLSSFSFLLPSTTTSINIDILVCIGISSDTRENARRKIHNVYFLFVEGRLMTWISMYISEIVSDEINRRTNVLLHNLLSIPFSILDLNQTFFLRFSDRFKMSSTSKQQSSSTSWKCPEVTSQAQLRLYNSFTKKKVIRIIIRSLNLFSSLFRKYL
jgi:hypothetical protein